MAIWKTVSEVLIRRHNKENLISWLEKERSTERPSDDNGEWSDIVCTEALCGQFQGKEAKMLSECGIRLDLIANGIIAWIDFPLLCFLISALDRKVYECPSNEQILILDKKTGTIISVYRDVEYIIEAADTDDVLGAILQSWDVGERERGMIARQRLCDAVETVLRAES